MATASSLDSSRRARRLLLAVALLAPCLAIYLIRYNIVVALAPIFLSHVLLLYATLSANCQWFGPVIRSFETDQPEVWLTIDDGPSPIHTSAMLDLLDRFEARATFFVIGKHAEQYPHLLTEILARGHEIANHTYSHPSATFWIAGPRRIGAEIDLTAELLRTAPDRPARFFRAPVGLKNLFVHPALDHRRLAVVGWSVRGLDTVRRDAGGIASRIARNIKPGAIVVLHEGHRGESHPGFHPECLELTLSALSEKGYRCVLPRSEQLRAQPAGK
jgi:peptidoglycan/xylan/chitin deacetylase (PgdA/CDA1 family)